MTSTTDAANHSLSKNVPNFQLVWDQTSLGTLQFCPRRYYYEIILGRVPRKTAVALTFGSLFHKSLEAFDKALALGAAYDDAVDSAVACALEESYGILFEDKYRNRETLLRTVVWYTDQYRNSPAKTKVINGKPAVELSFRFVFTNSSDGEEIFLAGHFDGVVDINGLEAIRERKTTTKYLKDDYWDSFKPNLQITFYSFASRLVFPKPILNVLLDAAQIGVGFTDFGQQVIARKASDLEEFQRDVVELIFQAERYAKQNYWPKYERNCWLCPFRKVCSDDPKLRQATLEADFIVRTWDPSQDRE